MASKPTKATKIIHQQAQAFQRGELLEMVKTLSAELFAQAGDSARAMHYVEQARALVDKLETA